jgi:nitrogen fixation protein NifU and related proteins
MLLRELYQDIIIDHSRQPRNFGVLTAATFSKEGFNPLCGDKLTLYLQEEAGILVQLQFVGCGCAISLASASLMTEALRGKSRAEAEIIFNDFHHLVTAGQNPKLSDKLGKLAVLGGVAEFPARVKCATLAWHTLKAALEHATTPVSTE